MWINTNSLWNIPNIITLVRIALIPVFVLIFYLPYRWSPVVGGSIFALAALSDWLDGYLARKLGQTTHLGAFLDPVADKLIVIVALVLLVELHANVILTIPAVVIIIREVTISALREWMAEIGRRASIAVSYVGKIKTSVQMIAITILLVFQSDVQGLAVLIGYIMLYMAVTLTLWSMAMYLRTAWPYLSELPGQ